MGPGTRRADRGRQLVAHWGLGLEVPFQASRLRWHEASRKHGAWDSSAINATGRTINWTLDLSAPQSWAECPEESCAASPCLGLLICKLGP